MISAQEQYSSAESLHRYAHPQPCRHQSTIACGVVVAENSIRSTATLSSVNFFDGWSVVIVRVGSSDVRSQAAVKMTNDSSLLLSHVVQMKG